MATADLADPQEQPLTLLERNDTTLAGTVTESGTPLDLSEVTLQLYLKPSRHTPDDDTAVTLLSTGSGITHGPATGEYSAIIPAAALTTPGDRWYRVDAVQDSGRRTAQFGPLYVINT